MEIVINKTTNIFYIIVLLQEASELFFPVKALALALALVPELSETSIAFLDLVLVLDSF